MVGTQLIARVRRLLKDVEDDTHKGEFWDDREVLLALNASQDVLINICLKNNYGNILHGLIKNTGNIATGGLPADYCHVINGMVGANAGSQRMARVYIGGECEVYRCAKSDAVLINGVNIYFINSGVQGRGMLTYYKYPSKIDNAAGLGTDLNDIDFEEWVYNDLITIHAAVLLGMKEVQTQREFKMEKRMGQDISVQPDVWVTYPKNRDITFLMEQRLQAMYATQRRAENQNV